MNLILRGIALLSALMSVGLTILMVVRMRRDRPLRLWALFVAGALSLVTLPLYLLLSSARLNPLIAVPVLGIGLFVGVLRGLTTRITHHDGEVLGRESWFFLLTWGGAVTGSQLLTLLGSALLAALGLIPLYMATGMQMALSGTLFVRRLLASPAPAR